jgi:hypothetical protein
MKGILVGKSTLGVLLALCAGMAPAQANEAPAPSAVAVIPEDQQATPEQLVRLIDVMRVKQQMASMTRSMPAIMQQQFDQQLEQMNKDNPQMSSKNEDQRQAMRKVMANFMEQSMKLYPAEEMIADVTGLYQKHLSRPDVEATIEFYSSAAGQHVLDMGPVLTQEFLPMVMQKTQERMRPLMLEMMKQMAEITASGADKPAQK